MDALVNLKEVYIHSQTLRVFHDTLCINWYAGTQEIISYINISFLIRSCMIWDPAKSNWTHLKLIHLWWVLSSEKHPNFQELAIEVSACCQGICPWGISSRQPTSVLHTRRWLQPTFWPSHEWEACHCWIKISAIGIQVDKLHSAKTNDFVKHKANSTFSSLFW